MRDSLRFLLALLCLGAQAAPLAPGEKLAVTLAPHNGRPEIFVNGSPLPLPLYSPVGWATSHFKKQIPWFAPHHMGAYFLIRPSVSGGWGASQFWLGDTISSTPVIQPSVWRDNSKASLGVISA